jgi:hypothetical protein
MYSFATATAWILFDGFGTVRLTTCLSSSDSIEGIVGVEKEAGYHGNGRRKRQDYREGLGMEMFTARKSREV